MNIKNIFSALLGFTLMFSACNSEDVDYAAPSAKTPGVHLRLTGAATGNTTSRATVEAEEGEKTVNSLVAVLFDTHEGFYKTVSATCINEDTNEYTFIVEKDATYDIWLVANASDKLKGELENIPEGTKMEDENGLNYLESITADQAPDAEGNFLMVSKYSEKVTTHITESQSIGEVHMIRLAARFDLLNKAEGVTVTNIEFANRTVKSAVLTPNTMNNASHWFEKKDYSLKVTGDPENGTAWNGKIYTYENHSEAESEQTPTLTITYYEGDDATETKTHEVKLIDPNSTTGKTMPIKRNNLYRIVLTKATKLDFDLQVLDWDDEEAEIEHPEVPLILPKDVQDSLNRQLLVYDLFAENFVKSIDFDNKTATLFDKIIKSTEIPTGVYYTYTDLKNKGLMGSDENAYLSIGGNNYRVPTLGELQLITPLDLLYIQNSQDELNSLWNMIYYSPNNMSNEKFSESVFLKNDANNTMLKSVDMSDESIAFSGESQLRCGYKPKTIYLDKVTGYYCSDDNIINCNKYTVYACYGIRFKGSNQYSAYRWESVIQDSITGCYYFSCKIKAIPENSNIDIDDIIDNHSFWSDGFIEIKIPYTGYYDAVEKLIKSPVSSYFLSSTLDENSTNRFYYFMTSWNSNRINNSAITAQTAKRPLLLVKVKNNSNK
ncbi:MAG: hypothetical protein HDS08_01795 [Bacteroides sp.]|nr:hypothetical protein [Bacteroides sp.]